MATPILPPARLVILGCFHKAQTQPNPLTTWEGHCKAFGKIVEDILDSHKIVFIGEEAEQTEPSYAAVIADRRNIHYESLDVPSSVQNQIRLHPRIDYNPGSNFGEKLEGKNKYWDAWNLVREYHMHVKFQELYANFLKGRNVFEPALLICGSAHQPGLAELLSKRFDIVYQPILDLVPVNQLMFNGEPIPMPE